MKHNSIVAFRPLPHLFALRAFFLHGTHTMPLWEVLPKNHPKISSINSGLFSPKIIRKSKISQLISVPQEKHMCTLYSICNFKIEVFTKDFIQHDFFFEVFT